MLRYTDGGKFFATVKYLTTIPLNGKIGSHLKQHELREEEVEVHKQWVDDNFGKDMKTFVKMQTKGTTYLVVTGLRRLKESLPFQSKAKSPESSTSHLTQKWSLTKGGGKSKKRTGQPTFMF